MFAYRIPCGVWEPSSRISTGVLLIRRVVREPQHVAVIWEPRRLQGAIIHSVPLTFCVIERGPSAKPGARRGQPRAAAKYRGVGVGVSLVRESRGTICIPYCSSAFDHHLFPRIAIVFSVLVYQTLPCYIRLISSSPPLTHPVPPCSFHIGNTI